MTGRRLPLIAHLALALLVTWPLAAHPLTALVGDGDADVWNHAWGPWWWASALADGGLPWRTALLRWPDGGVLWFIDPALALVAAPLVPLLGAAAAWNAALLLSVTLTSAGAARFARALAGEAGLSLASQAVASASAAGGAWVLGALHNGVSESLHLGPLAYALALGEEAVARPERGRWARAGLALGAVCWVSPYFGLAGGLALLVRLGHALASPGRGGRASRALLAPRGLGGLALGAAVAAPVLGLFSAQLGSTDALVRRPEGMNEQLALTHAADLLHLLAPPTFALDMREHMVHTAYLGLVALALAWGGRRGRGGWIAAAMVCAVMGLGPWLSWRGAWVELGGARVPLPWRAVQALAPWLALTHALRLAAPAVLIVSGLAAQGAARLRLPSPALAWLAPALVLLDGLALSGGLWPLATAPAQIPAVYAAIGQATDEGVLDLPTDAGATMATSRYLYWQTGHRHPIPYAPDARASTASLIDEPFFRALAARCARRPDEQASLGLDPSAPPATGPERLRDRRYRWIVLHPELDPSSSAELEALLSAWLGPGERIEGALRWDLGAQAARP